MRDVLSSCLMESYACASAISVRLDVLTHSCAHSALESQVGSRWTAQASATRQLDHVPDPPSSADEALWQPV